MHIHTHTLLSTVNTHTCNNIDTNIDNTHIQTHTHTHIHTYKHFNISTQTHIQGLTIYLICQSLSKVKSYVQNLRHVAWTSNTHTLTHTHTHTHTLTHRKHTHTHTEHSHILTHIHTYTCFHCFHIQSPHNLS